jgi:hypothetical protein
MGTKRTLGTVAAGLAGALAAWVALRAVAYAARRVLAAVRFGFYVATLQLYRRCPDCKSFIHRDAHLCRGCGFRLRPRPSR